MRILMLTDFYPPIVGGVEQHVRNLAAALAGRGHRVAVATGAHDGSPAYEVDGTVPVYRLGAAVHRLAGLYSDPRRRFAPPAPDPELILGLRRVIERERPQVVHAHNWLVHSFLPLKAWSGARLALSVHDYSLACPKKSFVYRGGSCSGPALAKCLGCGAAHYGGVKGAAVVLTHRLGAPAVRSMADLLLPVSHAVAAGNGIGEDARCLVVPNFVPDDIAARADPSLPCLAGLPAQPFVLFVGALGRHKGIHVLLEAYATLDGAPPLVMIGVPTSETPAVLPPGARILTDWPQAAVMAAWRRSLLAVVPSTWEEPCPTVVLEAMAAGRPVVASRVGGVSDLVVDGDTGLLVAAGDSQALAGALRRLLADPVLGARMGAAARRRAADFSARAVVPRIERALETLLAAPARIRVGADA